MRYIEQTSGNLKSRIYNHLFNIHKMKNISIRKHFNSSGNVTLRDFKVSILDHNIPRNGLNIRETMWISVLDTIPTGINMRDEARIQMEYQTLLTMKRFRHSR